mmetsp:Transcript_17337/g.20107  ORF Transcript_17337/g.20107 Transcript_17337/m.20107 type:complete len:85 (+) Transcript_17337:16-270(+)
MEGKHDAKFADSYKVEEDFSVTFKPSASRIKNIKVVEPAWIGDPITGHRTYRIMCDQGNEFIKVIRRYSHFEALRDLLILKFPQ